MGMRWAFTGNQNVNAQAMAAGVEMELIRSTPISTVFDDGGILILWSTNIIAGGDITAIAYRLYRGDMNTGTQLGVTATLALANQDTGFQGSMFFDYNGGQAHSFYTVTAAPSGGVVDSTCHLAAIAVMAL